MSPEIRDILVLAYLTVVGPVIWFLLGYSVALRRATARRLRELAEGAEGRESGWRREGDPWP